ncbi:MAG: response regulator [Candidatus Omnitrophica bacterium]|nr:response regulator [Candidatus Omnitrophota bacterium]
MEKMKAKILVVDDEKTIRDILETFLEKKGYEVATAATAEECLEKLKNEKPKIILLDIRLPGMSGVEAIKKIRRIDENVGVIMATAVLDEEVAKKTIEMGAADYIVKPFDLDYLEKTLTVKLASMV